ncbi:signal peptide peptidase SppA [Vulgatibacter incomptus]|uniref:Signal peptide peptidase SppA, 36K type n=1 Tax=Vulgatibacter incomptus TaxID=1391653 RepID=A0A0K1PBM2_9BACT|nr:signal peptide peptidase SppA [Vulgatibacter incomptus]AKU90897.1 signal peptide peptidase SppA, 36K type [Vulgatibacter incomptus]
MIFRLLAAAIWLPLRVLYEALRFVLLLPFPRKVPKWAVLRLAGGLPWRYARTRRWKPGKKPLALEEIERQLETAAREPALRGIVVFPEELHADPARLVALATALQRFRSKGKEVVLYWKQALARDFALVPAADRVLLAPGGMVLLVGHAAAMTSVREGLQKLGVVAEFFRIGRWKTAPERFTRSDISPEHRALVEAVLDQRQDELVAWVASRKAGDAEWAARVIDGGPYTSRRAVEAGLVDALVYPDEIGSWLGRHPSPGSAKESGADSTTKESTDEARTKAEKREPKLHGLGSIRSSRRWRVEWPKIAPPSIAVVRIDGLIKPGRSVRLPGGRSLAGERTVAAAMNRVREDPRIRGVIVAIDSRGGAAPASELMWRAVKRCAEAKPTVAYVESVAASGGYFAAAGAGRIVATPGALVGSIGVFSGRFDARALLDRLGIRQEVVLRGANAGILEPAHSLTDRERKMMEAEIAAIYEEFVDRVADGRRLGADEIRAHAEGRVFVASSAPKALVDEVGDFKSAMAWVCKEAGLDPERARLRIEEPRGMGALQLGELLSLAGVAASQPLLLWLD